MATDAKCMHTKGRQTQESEAAVEDEKVKIRSTARNNKEKMTIILGSSSNT
jgi:translation initiation factor 1 (eIF-1/SUI1)